MASAGTITVVVADDDDNIRAALRDLLDSAQGIEVVAEATSAEEAVAVWARHAPDVAILDVHMPGGGFAAARTITSQGSTTRVVMLTADDTPDARREAVDNGATRFVAKSGQDDVISVVLDVAGR